MGHTKEDCSWDILNCEAVVSKSLIFWRVHKHQKLELPGLRKITRVVVHTLPLSVTKFLLWQINKSTCDLILRNLSLKLSDFSTL